MKRSSIGFLKGTVFLIAVIILGLCVIWLPDLATEAASQNPEYAYLKIPVLLGVYITAIPFYFALYQALKLLTYIKTDRAFSEFAVASLSYIKMCALSIISIYSIGMVILFFQHALHPGVAIIGTVIIFATAVISFFSAVLEELLRSALVLKTENDLTV
ncbi:DUF2975 domain-containing protein [Anaerobacillus isosaccharinicus]|uniref:DUF2975 domain-containing protein n=1 Tax=Anaerobacillus isosaccharinicus TaxID=1532552 RepID=A0A1S2L5I2_9BACI|nr:DUF2975 domain-containing protein [Anaerobacillus isosaccharinicus]MBA5586368.1 DUF2975 domain-containing protein [Anaerobacillus isosaccharinicus]QOY35386.1 DUF2975 domain-containing protein [Anaerobacillus isosaccharinicus]